MKTPYDFGAKGDGLTDDTAAVRKWAAAGGGDTGDSLARYRINADEAGGAIRPGADFALSGSGQFLYGRGWSWGYMITPLDWTKLNGGWRIDGSQGAGIITDGPGDPRYPRKGLGLSYLTDFVCSKFGVSSIGGPSIKGADSFSIEVRGCRKGSIAGPRNGGDVRRQTGQIGSDGIHFTDDNEDITVTQMDILTSDDSFGVTNELGGKHANKASARIKFVNCIGRAIGFSGLKVLINALAGASTITDLEFLYCHIDLTLAALGAGSPIIATNLNRAGGGRVSGLIVRGSKILVTVPKGGLVGGSACIFTGIDGLQFLNNTVRHWHRIAVDMNDCPGAIVTGNDISSDDPKLVDSMSVPLRRSVPKPSKSNPAVIRAINCPGSAISTKGVSPGWAGQALVG